MKPFSPPPPELHDNRIIWLATRLLSLPFMLIGALYRLAKGLPDRFKSDETRRAEDQRHQSRVRRQLRGLPPDHVQESAKPE